MRCRLLLVLVMILLPCFCLASGYHYEIRKGGFWIKNGPAYFVLSNETIVAVHGITLMK